MSKRRPDVTPKLIESARLAARGASCAMRDAAIAEVAALPCLLAERVGAHKAEVAARLVQAVADLTGLDGEARTVIADKAIALADELARMPDKPGEPAPPPERQRRFYWADKD